MTVPTPQRSAHLVCLAALLLAGCTSGVWVAPESRQDSNFAGLTIEREAPPPDLDCPEGQVTMAVAYRGQSRLWQCRENICPDGTLRSYKTDEQFEEKVMGGMMVRYSGKMGHECLPIQCAPDEEVVISAGPSYSCESKEVLAARQRAQDRDTIRWLNSQGETKRACGESCSSICESCVGDECTAQLAQCFQSCGLSPDWGACNH